MNIIKLTDQEKQNYKSRKAISNAGHKSTLTEKMSILNFEGRQVPPRVDTSDGNYSVTGLLSIAFNLASLSMPSSLVTVATASARLPA